MTDKTPNSPTPKRVLVLGATGTAGRATVAALVRAGHQVTCAVRSLAAAKTLPDSVECRELDLSDAAAVAARLFTGPAFDTVVSCLASRSGTPKDAWQVDYQIHSDILKIAKADDVAQFVLLSAICVQKPKLAFQHAKLAFESELIASGLAYSIVRPTAYFKSISGQVDRLRQGKPFLIFGDGTLTACKPISDEDLGTYIADCLIDPSRQDAILPIGGPGDAITAKDQGHLLFEALGLAPRFRSVPVGLLSTIIAVTGTLGRVIPKLAEKAEFARIGRYYATESMLVWDAEAERYDAEATPSAGKDTLAEHYEMLARGDVSTDLREHAVF